MLHKMTCLLAGVACVFLPGLAVFGVSGGAGKSGAGQPSYCTLARPDAHGKMVYVPDDKGNIIPDFSHCGYGGGGVKLPDVPVRTEVKPGEGSDDARIQEAIDRVSAMPLDSLGFRGAVLLRKGRYEIAGTLRIAASGVVLRGEGQGEEGTVLVGTGRRKRTLIQVEGASGIRLLRETTRQVLDAYVPVGARSFRVASAGDFVVGDTVVVRRYGNADWIREIGMDRITPRPSNPKDTRQWKPFELDFDRVVTAVKGDRLEVDAPITCAIEAKWGGGEVLKYTNQGRIERVGVENLRGIAEFDPKIKDTRRGETYLADENHAWTFIVVDRVVNAWVRNVTAVHFGDNCVEIGEDAKWVTVQDSSCLDMVSKIEGGRRGAFQIKGQLCLVQRCEASTARHAYAVGSRVCGPNVFLHCRAERSYASSEAHHRWSVGGLFDNVQAPLAVEDRQYLGSGHGWAGANYVLWNCIGPVVCQKPPTAQNYVIGHVGVKGKPNFEGRPDGYYESFGRHVVPQSLYLQQLSERKGQRALYDIGYKAAR